jgi:putative DNA primase/helicase
MSALIDFGDLIERARGAPIEHEIERRGIKLRGRIDRCGPCPVCGGDDRFSVNIRKHAWNCRGSGGGYDAIGLVMHLDGCDFVTAVRNLAGERPIIRTSVVAPQTKQQSPDRYEREQRGKAAWLWSQRKPLAGSIAERYLREARGIDCPLPATLAYLPPTKPEHHPALIAAYGVPNEPEPGILAGPANVEAVHLILLKPDGTGKADIKPNKLTIGSPAGRPIVLAPPNDSLGLATAEGIEDVLSLHQTTGLGAWAVGGASFMPALADSVPSYIECVTIAVDDDDCGRRYATELAARLTDRSVQVEFLEIGR